MDFTKNDSRKTDSKNEDPNKPFSNVALHVNALKDILLQTARIQISKIKTEETLAIRILLDTETQRTNITIVIRNENIVWLYRLST